VKQIIQELGMMKRERKITVKKSYGKEQIIWTPLKQAEVLTGDYWQQECQQTEVKLLIKKEEKFEKKWMLMEMGFFPMPKLIKASEMC